MAKNEAEGKVLDTVRIEAYGDISFMEPAASLLDLPSGGGRLVGAVASVDATP